MDEAEARDALERLSDQAFYTAGDRAGRERVRGDRDAIVRVLDVLADREARLAELESALSWGTTCLNCASLLDRSYADYVRAEQAEARLAAVEALGDPEAMGRAMWKASGTNEDLILLARAAAASAVRAALHPDPRTTSRPPTGRHDPGSRSRPASTPGPSPPGAG